MVVVAPNDDLNDAVKIMRRRAVRRLPVVEGSWAVGIVSLGDIALEQEWAREPRSALAEISPAPPNV